jgi:uncharacterized cupredoxin-like copper-binding protein
MTTIPGRGRRRPGMGLVLTGVGALAAGGLVSGACADGGNGEGGLATETRPSVATGTDIAVTGTDRVRFEPDALSVPAGRDVALTFSAERGLEHDFVIEDAAPGSEDRERDLHVVHADAGEASTATFRISQPGTYTVYCSIPGHRQSGMVATLTVEEPG